MDEVQHPVFDMEYVFLQVRSKSVGESVELASPVQMMVRRKSL